MAFNEEEREAPTLGVREKPTAASVLRGEQVDWAETLPPGSAVDRYLIVHRVGAGGAGLVYAAYDPELDRKVAIKLLRSSAGGSTMSSQGHVRLLREAQAMARLNHPNVLPIYDVGTITPPDERDARVFLAVELVDGGTVRDWLDTRRTWREVLEVFMQAGRGLGAAHAAGLIHRDFKPDNVLRAADGRVRVSDFGLVRRGGDSDLGAEEPSVVSELSRPMTQIGTVMGTVGYMAPEQFFAGTDEERTPVEHTSIELLGGTATTAQGVDARSDQFAFCVSLYEALTGARPFVGETPSEIEAATVAGRIQRPADARVVPAWVMRAVERGLSARPDDRWPSMTALLDALERDPAIRRNRVIQWSLVALAGIAVVAGAQRLARREHALCSGGPARLAGIWDDATQQRLTSAFAATGIPQAGAAVAAVRAALDPYAQGWTQMHREACEATQRGEQSSELLALRMSCLDRRLETLAGLVQVFSQSPGPDVVKRAPESVGGLPDLHACADVMALRAPVPRPTDPVVRRRVGELEKRLDQAEAIRLSGRYRDGLAVATAIAGEAVTTSHQPLVAEAMLLKARFESDAGDYKAAEKTYDLAARAALSGRHDEVLADALLAQLKVVDYWQARHGEKDRLLGWALAAAARLPDDGRVAAQKWLVISDYARDDKPEEALDAARRSLAIRQRVYGDDHPRVADGHNTVGNTLRGLKRFDEALREYQTAIAIYERRLGPTHPDLCRPLHNLAMVAMDRGDLPRAEALLRRANTLRAAQLGADHPRQAIGLAALASVLAKSNKPAEAMVVYRETLAIYEKAFGRDYLDLAPILVGVGDCLVALGRVGDAVPEYERGLALFHAHSPDSNAYAEWPLARALWLTGDRARSRSLAASALKAYSEDPKDPTLTEITAWVAAHR